jgi:hypothetical protein
MMDWELARVLPSVEDAFGIAIPEEDAANLTTVNDLCDYVLARRFHGGNACLQNIAFYRIQRAVMSILQLPGSAVQPSTKLSVVMCKHRRRTWRAIEKQTGFRLPPLRRPQRIVTMSTLVAIGLGVSVPLGLHLKPMHGANLVAIVSIAVFGYLMHGVTEFFAYDFPPDVVTVGDLAKAALARNYQSILAESKKSATDAEVFDVLRWIFGEPLGIPCNQAAQELELSQPLVC